MSQKGADMTILGYINREDFESRDQPLPWQRDGRSQTATGYGRKLVTSTQIRVNGRWRRIYVCCYSNAGTAYITKGKDWLVVR